MMEAMKTECLNDVLVHLDEIKEWRVQGVSVRKIAQRLDVPLSRLIYAVRSVNPELLLPGGRRPTGAEMVRLHYDEIVQWRGEKRPWREIAQLLGMDVTGTQLSQMFGYVEREQLLEDDSLSGSFVDPMNAPFVKHIRFR